MNAKHFLFMVIAGSLIFAAAGPVWAGPEAPGSPSAYVSKMHYEFEPVLDGTDVLHNFILQNKGTAPLKIEKVHTD